MKRDHDNTKRPHGNWEQEKKKLREAKRVAEEDRNERMGTRKRNLIERKEEREKRKRKRKRKGKNINGRGGRNSAYVICYVASSIVAVCLSFSSLAL